jgi:hypothetical protein
MDLVEMRQPDNGYKYILNIVDVLTKRAISKPLKSKTTDEVLGTLDTIFKQTKTKPDKIWSDNEGCLIGKVGKEFFNNHNIVNYQTYGKVHNCVVERFNRTQKFNIENMRQNEDTKKWVKFIKPFTDTYNNTKHTTTKQTPNEALNNPVKSLSNLQKKYNEPRKESRKSYDVGDRVRISVKKGVFNKEIDTKWTTEIFVIHQVLNTNPTTYKIRDLNGEVLTGSFYPNEIQK